MLSKEETLKGLDAFLNAGNTPIESAQESHRATQAPHPSRPLTFRQKAAVTQLVANGGKSKAEAIRNTGMYSEAVARNPDRVFGSLAVRELMETVGLDEKMVLPDLKRKLKARKVEHMTFPPWTDKDEEAGEDDGQISEKQRGERMTDNEIRELLAGVNCEVKRIVHGDMARHVYYWTDNDKANLDALDMIFNLLGSYAPKKLDTKNEHNLKFSISELRRQAEANGRDVIEVENVPATQEKSPGV